MRISSEKEEKVSPLLRLQCSWGARGKKAFFYTQNDPLFCLRIYTNVTKLKKLIMDKILAFLSGLSPLSKSAKDFIRAKTQRQKYKKWDELLKPGEICRHVWFIENGLLHSFEETSSENKKTCNWFMLDNDIATSVASFFTDAPSDETVRALEDSVVWTMSKADLFAGIKKYPSLLMLTFLIVVKYYCQSRKIESLQRKKRPEELYAYLLKHHAEMMERVPNNHLCAFLGITEATFYDKVAPLFNKKARKKK
jgi:CRP/FNR family transcriptional regulator, anaerobic regulatory protein